MTRFKLQIESRLEATATEPQLLPWSANLILVFHNTNNTFHEGCVIKTVKTRNLTI